LIRGDRKKSDEYRSRVALVGQDLRDRDQEAILESKPGTVPHTGLLKARLLCDGGYFDEALIVMKSIDQALLDEVAYRLEYHYRMGRILQLGGNPEKAVPEFKGAFEDGKSLPYTFATRSALFLGKIYEEKKDYRNAADWYERCVDTYSSSHTTEGVKDMAEKGVKRVKGKY
jgi:tetratricopeptide (TPR) repeat protein